MSEEPTPEPVLTPVTGRARRPLSYSTFTDLVPDARLVQIARDGDTTTLVFDAALTPEQRQKVWARLTSTDDVDLADRELTTALMEEVKAMPETPLTRLVVRLARRRLMDQTNP